jgi:hypothetical protein
MFCCIPPACSGAELYRYHYALAKTNSIVLLPVGVILQWSASTSCVTLRNREPNTTIYCTPCGRVASGRNLQDPLLELFCDLAMPQSLQQPVSVDAGEGCGGGGPQTADMVPQATGILSLEDVCAQQECWGLLGLDLCSGEAELWESGSCQLSLSPGEADWVNTQVTGTQGPFNAQLYVFHKTLHH